jgi:hypothetical protein
LVSYTCPVPPALLWPARSEEEFSLERNSVKTKANGDFSVKRTAQTWDGPQAEGDATLGRFWLEKEFQGDLQATSFAMMLSAGGVEKGSAGYVAIEKVNGSLQGRKGSFVLQHNGTMSRGNPALTISVVPDSGTDELTGLCGEMKINIADGKHSYEFEYSLATIQ